MASGRTSRGALSSRSRTRLRVHSWKSAWAELPAFSVRRLMVSIWKSKAARGTLVVTRVLSLRLWHTSYNERMIGPLSGATPHSQKPTHLITRARWTWTKCTPYSTRSSHMVKHNMNRLVEKESGGFDACSALQYCKNGRPTTKDTTA